MCIRDRLKLLVDAVQASRVVSGTTSRRLIHKLEKIVDKFEKQGLDVTLITGKDYNVFGLVGLSLIHI